MLGRGQVFEIASTVVEGVKVFVVTFVPWRSLHELNMHSDISHPAVANLPPHDIPAARRAHRSPPVLAGVGFIGGINSAKEVMSDRYFN
jgi:hypothetical protein